jgi:hypothetical protein
VYVTGRGRGYHSLVRLPCTTHQATTVEVHTKIMHVKAQCVSVFGLQHTPDGWVGATYPCQKQAHDADGAENRRHDCITPEKRHRRQLATSKATCAAIPKSVTIDSKTIGFLKGDAAKR